MFNRLRNIRHSPSFTDDSLPRAALEEITVTVECDALPANEVFDRIMENVQLTGTAYTNGTYRIKKREMRTTH